VFDPNQIAIVRENWQAIRPKYAQFAELFFYYLFDEFPELRFMFHASPYRQQRDFLKIMDRVAFEDEETAIRGISIANKRYAKIPVQLVHYQTLEGALIRSLKEAQLNTWTPDLERAWLGVYKEVVYQLLSH